VNILLIKTTSLGDVLHATPHIRAVKARYPDAHLTVLTAIASAEIYAHHPAIDRLVLFDHARFKQLLPASPMVAMGLIRQTLVDLNERKYALAIDLQGLARTAVFLYFVHADNKFAKGRWPGLGGFRCKEMHAIDEMTQLLAQADIPLQDASLEFAPAPGVALALDQILAGSDFVSWMEIAANPDFVVISPFTRWKSKDWPLAHFIQAALELSELCPVIVTGTAGDRDAISAQLSSAAESDRVLNLAGKLNLAELGELMSRAALVISGDSFPMHLASAVGAPLIALFGPTDERKTGPRSSNSEVVRPADCSRCDQPDCARACLARIPVARVTALAQKTLEV
jgi:heptosyltransferase-2